MEHEFHVSGRVLVADAELFLERTCAKRSFSHGDVFFNLSVFAGKVVLSLQNALDAEFVSDALVLDLCQKLSAEYSCKVLVYRGREDYGVANVFNGGSDYEVVNEEWFMCVCENGAIVLEERTNRWNERIEEFL